MCVQRLNVSVRRVFGGFKPPSIYLHISTDIFPQLSNASVLFVYITDAGVKKILIIFL